MNYLKGLDISQYNNYVPGSEDFVIIKMSGGDAGLYFDSKATAHYTAASQAGKVVGGYHFAGGGNPIAEADYFVRAMSPVAKGDLFALDWEIQHTDPVGWCLAFVNEVHTKTSVWPFLYINISTCNAYDWSPVLNNCGLWLAAPSFSPDANAPVHHPYVLQQGPIVGGIDSDYGFLTRDQLLAYGSNPGQPAPATTTTTTLPPATTTTTQSTTTTTTTLPPVSTTTTLPPDPNTTNINWLVRAVKAILKFFHIRVN